MELDAFLQQANPTEWIVRDLVPANQKGLIVARAGSGKSWFLESLALAVTSGTDFLGRYPVLQPGAVLLVDQDSPQAVLAERLAAYQTLSAPAIHSLYVESQQGRAIDQAEGIEKLSRLVAQIRPILVILETLDTVTSSSFNEDKAKDTRHFFKNLDRLQAQHRCAIIISHHFGKKGQVGEPTSWIRGSSALPACVDVGYGLQRLPSIPGSFLVQPFPKRVKTAPSFQMKLTTTEQGGKLHTAALHWVRDWDMNLDPELMEKREAVLELVRDRASEGVTVDEVKAAVAGYLSERDVREILNSLSEEGLAGRGREAHNRFRFWVPDSAPVASGGQSGEDTSAEEGYQPL